MNMICAMNMIDKEKETLGLQIQERGGDENGLYFVKEKRITVGAAIRFS